MVKGEWKQGIDAERETDLSPVGLAFAGLAYIPRPCSSPSSLRQAQGFALAPTPSRAAPDPPLPRKRGRGRATCIAAPPLGRQGKCKRRSRHRRLLSVRRPWCRAPFSSHLPHGGGGCPARGEGGGERGAGWCRASVGSFRPPHQSSAIETWISVTSIEMTAA